MTVARQPVDQAADRKILGHGAVAVDEHNRLAASAHDDVHRHSIDRDELAGGLRADRPVARPLAR
nr:hypothetical protein [Methylorubrum zatmanii]